LPIIPGAAKKRVPMGFAPIAVGLGLTLIHLFSISVTDTSVNPARSTGLANFVGGRTIYQLCLFWVAPAVGAVLGATDYKLICSEKASSFEVPSSAFRAEDRTESAATPASLRVSFRIEIS
jgi:aquaporin Z